MILFKVSNQLYTDSAFLGTMLFPSNLQLDEPTFCTTTMKNVVEIDAGMFHLYYSETGLKTMPVEENKATEIANNCIVDVIPFLKKYSKMYDRIVTNLIRQPPTRTICNELRVEHAKICRCRLEGVQPQMRAAIYGCNMFYWKSEQYMASFLNLAPLVHIFGFDKFPNDPNIQYLLDRYLAKMKCSDWYRPKNILKVDPKKPLQWEKKVL